jgi:hypothetical protein
VTLRLAVFELHIEFGTPVIALEQLKLVTDPSVSEIREMVVVP